MFARSLVAMIAFLGMVALSLADDNGKAKTKAKSDAAKSDVEEFDLKDFKVLTSKGALSKAFEVKKAADVGTVFPNRDDQAKVNKAIDFNKKRLLFFTWSGSGEDKLTFRVQEKFPPNVIFTYTAGMTKDSKSHAHAFVVNRVASYRLETKPEKAKPKKAKSEKAE